jgi:transposase
VLPKSWRALLVQAGSVLADSTRNEIPQLLRGELLSQLESLRTLTSRIQQLEQAIASYRGRLEDCKRIEAIPGIGRLTSSALVATIGDARTFRSGREMAAFLGLVPRQSGTGGRVRLMGISKRGDPYLRTLLIHGARSVITHGSRPGRTLEPWIQTLLLRRPKNVAIVALANKMARTAWALLAHGRSFDRSWGQALPAPVNLTT